MSFTEKLDPESVFDVHQSELVIGRHSGAALQGAPPGPRPDEQHIPGQGGGDILHGHRAEEAHSHHSGNSVPLSRSLYDTVPYATVRYRTDFHSLINH
jgi:hypothetical protein